MGCCELKIVNESLNYDDNTLVEIYSKLERDFHRKKKEFECNLKNLDKNNYLHLAMSRLKYEFIKEEFNAFSGEMAKRGLYSVNSI